MCIILKNFKDQFEYSKLRQIIWSQNTVFLKCLIFSRLKILRMNLGKLEINIRNFIYFDEKNTLKITYIV